MGKWRIDVDTTLMFLSECARSAESMTKDMSQAEEGLASVARVLQDHCEAASKLAALADEWAGTSRGVTLRATQTFSVVSTNVAMYAASDDEMASYIGTCAEPLTKGFDFKMPGKKS